MAFRPITRVTVWRQIADQITDAILGGELVAGDTLPTERELVARFGVSRASVREALRALEAQGLLMADESNPTQPRIVAHHAPSGHLREALAQLLRLCRVDMADLVDFRCVMEVAGVRRAAERRDADLLEEASKALDEVVRQQGNIETFEAADLRFHVALIAASRNEVMLLVMKALRETATRRFLDVLKNVPDPATAMHKLNREHTTILEAVKAGDGDEAAELMTRHITDFYSRATTPDLHMGADPQLVRGS